MENTIDVAAKGGGTLLDWVAKYGIASVFAIILLGSVLYNQYVAQQQILTAIQEQSRTNVEITRTLDRLNTRLELIERGR